MDLVWIDSKLIGLVNDYGKARGRIYHRITFDGREDKDYIGDLGEAIVCKYLGRDIAEHFRRKLKYGDPGHDIIIGTWHLDVKNRTVYGTPKPDYGANVAEFQLGNNCNSFIFPFTLKEWDRAYITGWCSKEHFKRAAVFHTAGWRCPDNPQLIYREDGRDIEIDLLRDMSELLTLEEKLRPRQGELWGVQTR